MPAAENAESEASSDSDEEVIVISDAEVLPNKTNVPSLEFEPLVTHYWVAVKLQQTP